MSKVKELVNQHIKFVALKQQLIDLEDEVQKLQEEYDEAREVLLREAPFFCVVGDFVVSCRSASNDCVRVDKLTSRED